MKILIIFLCLVFVLHLSATIINIPADQPTIQDGINVTVDGDTVLVQPGIYFENINFFGKNIMLTSNFITTQDTFYIEETIINGSFFDHVVVFENGETSMAILNGFTITDGIAYSGYGGGGGGIICKDYSHPVISNNIITNCRSELDGGGIFCFNYSNPEIVNNLICENAALFGGAISCWHYSNPSITENRIINNFASYNGGGLYLGEAYNGITVIHNLIQNNSASYSGGGIFSFASNPLISNNHIIFNHSDTYGGGIYTGSTISPYIINNNIESNSADVYGGGISCSSNSNPILTNVIINDNTANWGAGIYCYDNSSAILNNVVIYNNTAIIEGGGILNDSCNLNITNSTITMNDAPLGAGIFCSGNSNLNILNSILWNNQPQGMYISGGTIINIYYSNYQGAGGYFGNIDEDPLFVGTGEDPYSLLENSPCIDTGIPDTLGLNLPPWDIIGNHRIWDGDGDGTAIIDMGAYEYDALPYVDVKDNIIVYTSEAFLHQNYPNPFNPTTTISFSIQEASKVELSIFNIKGQKIKSLLNDQITAGDHSTVWNGEDASGKIVSSGVYLYNLNVNNKIEAVKKCLLLK